MRKIIVFNLVSVDGYFAGPNGEIDWHNVDDEFNKFAVEQTAKFGAIIFGRVTYQLFEDFWPKALKDPKTSKDDLIIAKNIDEIEKIVFSKTLKKVTWNNSKLFNRIDPIEIKKWKQKKGGDMVIFGSGKIVQAMANLGLIDEYRLIVNPVILGRGRPMFENVKKLKLKLTNTKVFKNGNVLLYFEQAKTTASSRG